MVSDIHQRLRAATRTDHERLEARMDIFGRVAVPDGRRRLVERFYGLHAAAEAALAPWLDAVPALDFAARRRLPRLAADLAALGAAPPPAGPPLAVASRGEAFGLMYVLEGSTLGGRAIRARLAQAGSDFRGLSFLDPYGPETGARFRAFLAAMAEGVRGPAEAEACVAGGVRGFRLAEERLCEAPAHG